MSIIQIEQLTFGYEGSSENVFEQLNLRLDTRWKIGLTGRNGRGKTTLLRLLDGTLLGTGRIHGSAPMKYFPVPVSDPQKSVLEIAEEIAGDELWRIYKELSLLGLSEDILTRPYHTLSGGEQVRVCLAALFADETAFPLIDELTNHLDADGRRQTAEYLQKKQGFLLVSHDRDFLDRCIDHVLAFNRSGPQIRRGSFTDWYEEFQKREESELLENQRLKKDIKRLEESAWRTAQWSERAEQTKKGAGVPDRGFIGAQAARMMKRSMDVQRRREKEISKKEALLQDSELSGRLILPGIDFSGTAVYAGRLSAFYGGRPVFENLSFSIRAGQKIALTGANGSGKSTLLRLLAGEAVAYSGVLQIAAGLKISYVPQITSFLKGGLREYIRSQGADESRVKTVLRKMGFERELFDRDMSGYSQGQKKKVLLAVSLCSGAAFYIWDEPLNYVDILSRIQIEEALAESQAAMIFTEHDCRFCERIGDLTIDL